MQLSEKQKRTVPMIFPLLEGPMSNLQKAIAIAVEAHEGQTDKGGSPYILHPLRVMMSLKTEDEMIVGVLHDVIEDCSDKGFDWERLRQEGFTGEILEALYSVTKTPEEEAYFKTLSGEEKISAYLKFVARAKQNPIGRRVKRADIFENLNVSRLGELREKDLFRLNQYKRAVEFLDSN